MYGGYVLGCPAPRLSSACGVEPGERFGQRDGQVHLLPVRLGEQFPETAAQYCSGLWVGGAIRAGAAAVTGSGACVAAGDVPGLAGVAAVARTGEPSPSLPQVQRSTGCFAFHTSTSCCASSIVIAVRLSQFCARRLRRAVFVRVPSVGLPVRLGGAVRCPVAGYSRFCESIQIVTGPSLTSATCMSAPKTPVSTRPVAPWRTAATNDS